MSAETEIQKALHTALSGLAALTGIGASVRDIGPRAEDGATIYPYVSVGFIALGEWDTDRDTGFDALMRVHSYSNTGSLAQVKTMQGAIYDALHRQPLSVTGFQTVLVRREDSFTQQLNSGVLHGVCEYRGYFRKS